MARTEDVIGIRGARQNNLRSLDLDIPLGELVVVTGVSGSGKSSLVFDTVYAEGQRRYVETFSPYARQFLDRMDRPLVDRVDGIPAAIAIDQSNPVRTSRSTVGTMTELNDHLKLLYARAARLHCRDCGRPVYRDTPQSVVHDLETRAFGPDDPRLLVSFPVTVPENFDEGEVLKLLEQQGYTRIQSREGRMLEVVQDRFRAATAGRSRMLEAVEAAMRVGRGRVAVRVDGDGDSPRRGHSPVENGDSPQGGQSPVRRYSTDLHCADCDIHYREPTPSLFSFNSPLGACETCRGFGRVIGVDWGLVAPDESRTLRGGAVKPWQTQSYKECQDDLVRFARKRGVPLDTPWRELSEQHRRWVIDGEGPWEKKVWYGARRFFAWLEGRSYKMHIRVLLSKYRSYTPCPDCGGARLKPEALLWRLGSASGAGPGPGIHDLMLLPVERVRDYFAALVLPAPLDDATDLLLGEIRSRLEFLVRVGLGYLTLDRQSRTLSGGEVQRINLTTALGTSLVNTLFVLDEPSIGLHPRDMRRVVEVMQRLRDNGNSLLVVEHDPQIMLAADRVIDMGPGPGERGGEIVFNGTPGELMRRSDTLTAEYLSGRKDASVASGRRGPPREGDANLLLTGASEHNLRGFDVEIPLGRLVCVTGVSGSGKSTLVQDVLLPALLRAKGRPTEAPGAHRSLSGAENVDEVVMVDQAAIGRTTRSNPASYVGAFDAIRRRFTAEPVAIERGYTPGTFSFNSGTGRCPTCSGSGFEHVEMQFLSDVYLRCPDCNGRRYRAETLEVKLSRGDGPARSIADVLDMTVSEALAFFEGDREIAAALEPLVAVGLDYLKLGQPVPTLSGGEAQRLKLAGHLAGTGDILLSADERGAGGKTGARHRIKSSGKAAAKSAGKRAKAESLPPGGSLFLFDEPTTGLHFDDVAKLLGAFRRLLDAGHSLVVIEHNLDVIRASDWIIDLGPEGGEGGGALIAAGTPEVIAGVEGSHTGQALREFDSERKRVRRSGPAAARTSKTEARDCGCGTRLDRRAPGPRAQPARCRCRYPARRNDRRHRRVGLRQVHARVRHCFCRGSAPLPRVPERLRAAVRATGRPAGRGRDIRYPADGRNRATHQPRRPQEHGGYADRGSPLPAPAVRQARHAALPGLRPADRAAEHRFDRGDAGQQVARPDDRAAGAAGSGTQGLLHRPRALGRRPRARSPAGGRGIPVHCCVAETGAVPRAHDRTAAG